MTSLFKTFSQNPKKFVRCDITISRIKPFEVKNHFHHLFFCHCRPFFDNSAWAFPLKIQLKQRERKFSWENQIIECVSLQENKPFLIFVQATFGRKSAKTFAQVFSQNTKSSVECEITISRINSFEVYNHFPQLFFCQRRLLFWQPCRSFPTKNPKKQPKWTFFRKNHFIESVSLEGNKAFWTIVPGKIW